MKHPPSTLSSSPKASAIIPAYNEGARVVSVIRALERHPLVGEIIVVSDGSTDDTVARARRTRAKVIELTENVGKGEAMARGVAAAKHDVIAFFDADLIGLKPAMIDDMIRPVLEGGFDMFAIICDRKSEVFQAYVTEALVVSGMRALRKDLWNLVPAKDRQGFQVELALNYYALQNGRHIGSMIAKGLLQVVKEKKRGLWLGMWLRLKMTFECGKALWKLHLFGEWRSAAA